jgi:hypothetical protein
MILHGWVAFLFGQLDPAQRDIVIEQHIGADLGGFADHGAHAVVDHQARADRGAGVDFDPGQKAPQLRNPAGDQIELVHPQPVGQAIKPGRMQTRIAEHDLQLATRRRVALKVNLDIATDSLQHNGFFLLRQVGDESGNRPISSISPIASISAIPGDYGRLKRLDSACLTPGRADRRRAPC